MECDEGAGMAMERAKVERRTFPHYGQLTGNNLGIAADFNFGPAFAAPNVQPVFTAAQLQAGLPIKGDVSQTVDPDNNNQNCVMPSQSQVRGTYTLDVNSWRFSYDFTFGSNAPNFNDNLLFKNGFATLLHFHGPAPRGQAAPNPINVSSTRGSFLLTAAQGAEVQEGLWYLNIHSSLCPNGELRAQMDIGFRGVRNPCCFKLVFRRAHLIAYKIN